MNISAVQETYHHLNNINYQNDTYFYLLKLRYKFSFSKNSMNKNNIKNKDEIERNLNDIIEKIY